ncbi:MAG: hypothetical protein MR270_03860 [Erysipelotrichaceae bacterium]|nr:hypothetical protein [Erysipelotrichaceae bacterium]
MKYKTSIIIGMLSMLTGFIPMSFKKEKNITYEIYSCNIQQANLIKKELLVFYKKYCYSFSYSEIDKKISENIVYFPYDCSYENHVLTINEENAKIKMMGYLFYINPSSIDFKYYFSTLSSTCSIPDAISINVATLTLSDQI